MPVSVAGLSSNLSITSLCEMNVATQSRSYLYLSNCGSSIPVKAPLFLRGVWASSTHITIQSRL